MTQAERPERVPERVAIIGSRDFPYPEAVRWLVTDLPPGTVVVSGHGGVVDLTAEQAARDAERTRYLATMDIAVLRFTDTEILQAGDAVAQAIGARLSELSPRFTTPSP